MGYRSSSFRRCLGTGLAFTVACATVTVLVTASPAMAAVFSNATTITLPDPNCTDPDAGSPYPSSIVVSGLTGTVSDVNVTLKNVSHTYQEDIDALLVGPAGQNLVLVSDAGNGISAASNVTLTLDDAAGSDLPQTQWGAANSSVTYRPKDYDPLMATDIFPAPAPAPSAATALSTFNGTNGNGTWSLYVTDDACDTGGSIAGGWSLDITSVAAAATNTSLSSSLNPSRTGNPVTFTATVASSSTVNTGTVTFTDGATVLAANVAVNGSGVAAFTTSTLVEGNHLVTATYNGNGTFATSNNNVNQRVDNNTTVTGSTYCNTGAVAIPVAGQVNGPAFPYPSNIFVASAPTLVQKVTVTLKNVTHGFDGDIDALLVGPAGQNLTIVSDAGTAAVSAVTVNLDDAAASSLPVAGAWAAANATITAKPTDYVEGTADTFPSPAPAVSGATTLATFNNTNPNGTWRLYATDDGAPDTGSIAGGWCLNFTFDTTPPTVGIVQAAGQADPTQHSPINFTATFSEAVTGFTGTDVSFAGSTSGGTKVASVTGGPIIYTVAVTGMTTSGTVIATIPAGGASDLSGNTNTASAGGDNTVSWVLDTTKPACSYTIVPGPGTAHIDFTITDAGSGLASITFPTLNNIVTPVPVPAFTVGSTSPVSFTATKLDNTQRAQIAVVITDVAGVQASCI